MALRLSDNDLVRLIEADPAALETFYRRHVDRVMRFATARCACAEDAADVVSATFETVISASRGFDPRRGSARAWLLGIAAHEASALHRHSAGQRRAFRRLHGRRLLDEDDIARLEAQIESQRLAPNVSMVLRNAPLAERELFLLIAQDGLTPSEAAQVLGISAGAARVRLSRVRRRLRQAISSSDTARNSVVVADDLP